MVVHSSETSYTILNIMETSADLELMTGRDEQDQLSYLLFSVKNKRLAVWVAEFFYHQVQKAEFTDFRDVFLYGNRLYAVLRYYEDRTLASKLEEENMDLLERLEIGKNLLEKFILSEMPLYFRCTCLGYDGVLVTQASEIQFFYSMGNLGNWKKYDWNQYLISLTEWMKVLFSKEKKEKFLLPILEFVEKLEKGIYTNDQEIYKKYLEVQEDTIKQQKEGIHRKPSIYLRIWNQLKKWYQPAKRIAVLLILLCAIAYVVYSIWLMDHPKEVKKIVYDAIGTVQLEK